MQLNELSDSTISSKKLGQLLKENFGIDVPVEKITVGQATKYRNMAQQKIIEFRASEDFYSSERNPAYLGMIMLHQCLGQLVREAKEKPAKAPKVAEPFRIYANSRDNKHTFKCSAKSEKKAMKIAERIAHSSKFTKVRVTKIVNGREVIVEGKFIDAVKGAVKGGFKGALHGALNAYGVPTSNSQGARGQAGQSQNTVQLPTGQSQNTVRLPTGQTVQINDPTILKALADLNATNLSASSKEYFSQAAITAAAKGNSGAVTTLPTQAAPATQAAKVRPWRRGQTQAAPTQAAPTQAAPTQAASPVKLSPQQVAAMYQANKNKGLYNQQESLKESVIMNRAKRMILEGEMENAEAALAAKDLVDRLQSMIEELGKMNYQELPHLIDAIRTSFGSDAADAYQAAAGAQLAGLLTMIGDAKGQLNNATLVLTGEEQPTSDELGQAGSELDDTLPSIAGGDDDFAPEGGEEEAEAEPLGRGKRKTVKETELRLRTKFNKTRKKL